MSEIKETRQVPWPVPKKLRNLFILLFPCSMRSSPTTLTVPPGRRFPFSFPSSKSHSRASTSPELLAWLWQWQSLWSNTLKDLLNKVLELVLLLLIAMPAKWKGGKKNPNPLWVTHSVPLNASAFSKKPFKYWLRKQQNKVNSSRYQQKYRKNLSYFY